MEAFWKWLMRANARWVFASSLVALILVVAWWTWKQFAPPPAATRTPSSRRAPVEREGLKLLEYVESQLAMGSPESPRNPFLVFSARPPKHDRPKPDGTGEPVAPVVPPDQGQGGATAPEAPAPPPEPSKAPDVPPAPPPTHETISLTYRGLFQRPDGQVLALIEDSKRKSSAFYLSGKELFGLKVGEIKMEDVGLVAADGSAGTLRIGQPQNFEVPIQ